MFITPFQFKLSCAVLHSPNTEPLPLFYRQEELISLWR
jgi:hypothetical protein